MVVYTVTLEHSHSFDGWFDAADKFDKQRANRQISVPNCSATDVTRQLSAPYVNTGATHTSPIATKQTETALAGLNPQHLQSKFIEYIIQNTEDVGAKCPEEARKIYYGETDNRSIRGEASGEAIKELQEEGIDVYGLPVDPLTPDNFN